MNGARVVTLTAEMQGLEQRLVDMDAVGIDAQVLSLSAPNVYFPDAGQARELARGANEHFAEVVASAGGRFRAFASVPINHPEVALVLGSDYPHVIGDPEAAVETIEGLEIEEEERDAIFAGNLLGLLDGFRPA